MGTKHQKPTRPSGQRRFRVLAAVGRRGKASGLSGVLFWLFLLHLSVLDLAAGGSGYSRPPTITCAPSHRPDRFGRVSFHPMPAADNAAAELLRNTSQERQNLRTVVSISIAK
jgi:hypothetical protein